MRKVVLAIAYNGWDIMQEARREVEELLNASEWKKRLCFSIRDIHEITGRPINTLNDFIRAGKIKAMRSGRAWLVSRSAFIQWWIDMTLEGHKGGIL